MYLNKHNNKNININKVKTDFGILFRSLTMKFLGEKHLTLKEKSTPTSNICFLAVGDR